MSVWVALLRGINVGGHNRVPMGDLRAALADDGFEEVATYIASGNVVLRAQDSPATRIGELVTERFGHDIAVVARTGEQLRAAIAANPFAEMAERDPKLVHCCFTSEPVADRALDDVDLGRYEPDRAAVGAGEIFVGYPNGAARSKLTNAVIERLAGGPVTARNWNTVLKLASMVTAAGG